MFCCDTVVCSRISPKTERRGAFGASTAASRRSAYTLHDWPSSNAFLPASIKSLSFEQVQARPLKEIWQDSAVFNAYRGDAWMQEPCRSCERKHLDWGGCRCQAMAIAGDPAATDPVCSRSPHNAALRAAAEADSISGAALTYRVAPA